MTQVSRTLVIAALLWLGLHVTLGVISLPSVGSEPLHLLATALLLAGSGLSLWPLLEPGRPEPAWAAPVLAAAIPLTQALNLASLDTDTTGYANWANGGNAVMLAGLVLRDRIPLALVAGAATVALQSVVVLSGDPRDPVLTVLLLAVPTEMWLLAPWAVRAVVTRADRVAAQLNSRAAAEAAAGPVPEDWESVRTQRLRELELQVLPFLSRVAEDRPVGAAERAEAGHLARTLRDTLLARQLLDPAIQESLSEARARGVRVSLSSDATTGPLAQALRARLPRLLGLDGLTALAVRLAHDPQVATVVAKGTLVVEDVLDALGPHDDLDLEQRPSEGGLVVSIRPRDPSPGVSEGRPGPR